MHAITTQAGSSFCRCSPGHHQPDVGLESRLAGPARWPRSPGGDGRGSGPGLPLLPVNYEYVVGEG